jgi:farnesyl-diphosphate farnesyltransferase
MLTLEQQGIHLQQVSRTFALTIPVLPMPLADWVGNAYLLCRIVDTIEDDAHLSCTEKQRHIDAYMTALQGSGDVALWSHQLAIALSPITPAGEQALIADIPAVLARLFSFPLSVQQILIQGVSIMCRGMSLQQAQFMIAERGDLDRYCYHVAGVVGELLTELFSVYRPSLSQQKNELLPLAVSFGEGLQLTNILKDVQEDASRGVCWLPQQELAARPQSIEAIAPPQQLMDDYVALAHGHLLDAVRFTLKLPRSESGMRQFCLWAIGMALLTLCRVHANPLCNRSTQVKISRRQVKGVILTCKLAGWSNSLLNLYFKWLGRSLPLTSRDVDELHQRVSAWQ